ncbi:hypothetical protein OG555_24675 [Kribbella sp. NBC_01484]|uniref:hypothetical protein n=1 Tax=Kribbella sp. NBC_01484 TaxID=2903579 RepID=UPI002E3639E4|nr:hypothetical protein [Kribbella sp. NBC_01484]
MDVVRRMLLVSPKLRRGNGAQLSRKISRVTSASACGSRADRPVSYERVCCAEVVRGPARR